MLFINYFQLLKLVKTPFSSTGFQINGNSCIIFCFKMKIAKFTNSVDLDEVAHNEPPHLDLYCLPSSL